jgi:hypothetical protein
MFLGKPESARRAVLLLIPVSVTISRHERPCARRMTILAASNNYPGRGYGNSFLITDSAGARASSRRRANSLGVSSGFLPRLVDAFLHSVPLEGSQVLTSDPSDLFSGILARAADFPCTNRDPHNSVAASGDACQSLIASGLANRLHELGECGHAPFTDEPLHTLT